MLHRQELDRYLDEDRIAELVDAVKRAPEQRMRLVELLPEQHPLYRNRGTNQAVRMRGYILAAFEQAGLPDAALPYVLQELETGHDAYLVAGAARALRGLERPVASVVPFLFRAIENIRDHDDAVTFEVYKPRWPLATYTTALGEIFKTFAWLGSAAHAAVGDLEALGAQNDQYSVAARAGIAKAIERIRAAGDMAGTIPLQPRLRPVFGEARPSIGVPGDLELEDQHGQVLRFGEYFCRAPSIVVFFYTRCNNPNKCSLTISKLAQLQQRIAERKLSGQLQTAAITYDPLYDRAPRLRAYGLNRGVRFGTYDRFFRAPGGQLELQRFFELGVNYNRSAVNQHRVELFVLDRQASIAATYARLQWDIDDVLESAGKLLA